MDAEETEQARTVGNDVIANIKENAGILSQIVDESRVELGVVGKEEVHKVNGDVHDKEATSRNTIGDDRDETQFERKRKRSIDDLDEFLGFKKKSIEEAADYFAKILDFRRKNQLSTFQFDCDPMNSSESTEIGTVSLLSETCYKSVIMLGKSQEDTFVTSRVSKTERISCDSVLHEAETSSAQSMNSTKSEYAQYLGLQPTVKFKCIKCSTSNFPTLSALNKHLERCPEDQTQTIPALPSPVPSNSSTNFKITRRVYLCSACGVYFEIWKLFLHMRTAHRRYICLICLGLFSIAERLSNHLVVKHDIVAKNYDSITKFFQDYVGQIFVMCCECEKMFTEKDNFVDHICEPTGKDTVKIANSVNSASSNQNSSNTSNKPASIQNADSASNSSTLLVNSKSSTGKNKTQKSTTKLAVSTPKLLKFNSKLKNKILPSEHVTGDTHIGFLNDTMSENVAKNESEQNSVQETKTSLEENEVKSPSLQIEDSEKLNENNSSDQIRKMYEIDKKENLSEKDDLKTDLTENEDVTKNPEESNDNSINSEVIEIPEKISESDNIDKEEGESKETLVLNENEPSENLNSLNDSGGAGVPTNGEQLFNHSVGAGSPTQTPTGQLDSVVSGGHMSDTSDRTDEVMSSPVLERRRVPKVTLKIPPNVKTNAPVDSDSDSDDSCKLTMEVDMDDNSLHEGHDNQNDKDNALVMESNERSVNGDDVDVMDHDDDAFPVAGVDIQITELGLRPPLDKVSIQSLLKDFLRTTCYTCVYCNYARKIAVNGKQLGLHMIAEHRFSATADSITAEELLPETFVARIQDCFDVLQTMYFNLESYDNEDSKATVPYDRIYECFQCRFVTTVHKELYLHNRKMHQKTILLCIMCKSTFYSYSELLCHMCPGVYNDSEVLFRCCLCPQDSLPSAFRLMVHLRKRHHACDVCLETCSNQARLSNHVWKHKLHHLCYRCGIAYRNKPDITKHLFWKHGTESVLCKKCLQKKWPHVYHFCIPPVNFVCEECNRNFSKAVALKVHKRFHSNTKPYACEEENCIEIFVSKKLLEKHIIAHREPPPSEYLNPSTLENEPDIIESQASANNKSNKIENGQDITLVTKNDESPAKDNLEETKTKPVLDVYDLPALNLSESDSDDSDDNNSPHILNKNIDNQNQKSNNDLIETDEHKPAPIVDGIWDNFKNYQAAVEKQQLSTDIKDLENNCTFGVSQTDLAETNTDSNLKDATEVISVLLNAIMSDHDYCANTTTDTPTAKSIDEDGKTSRDYYTDSKPNDHPENIQNSKDKTTQGGNNCSSSSDSDSSSCTCGSNCSCTSSSSGSSSSSSSSSDSDSSSSEGRRRNEARRQKRKERARNKKKTNETPSTNATTVPDRPVTTRTVIELPVYESDLYTDESETDEDFYDESPQLLAKKLIEEKKNQLILDVGGPPSINGSLFETSRSSTPVIPEVKKKIKVKSKKRKKNPKNRTPPEKVETEPLKMIFSNSYFPPPKNNFSYTSHSPKLIHLPSRNHTPTCVPSQSISSPILPQISNQPLVTTPYNSNAGSGSETDSALRLSKRRRVPNRFYGYSSDDESAGLVKPPEPPQLQWNKEDLPSPPRIVQEEPPPHVHIQPTWHPLPVPEPEHAPSASSSASSDSDLDSDDGRLHIREPEMVPYSAPIAPPSELYPRPAENLYCYCQCPYDEVSEMIACDGKNCAIEWFHFECVGIMVPPKGKWFCPDCRKQSSQRPEYFMT